MIFISSDEYCMCCNGNPRENGKNGPLRRNACPTWIQYRVDCRFRDNKGIRLAKLFPDGKVRVFGGGPERCNEEQANIESKIIISRISKEELKIELPDNIYKIENEIIC